MTQRTQLPSRTGGFTLAELAIVVLISGILLTAGLQMLVARMEAAQIETTRRHQETIKQALIAYLGQMKRLPCPDTNVDGLENRDTPTTPAPCNAYIGTVPYRDLGLDRSIALDGFENFISYVVSPAQVATPPVAPAPPAPPWTTAWLYSYRPTAPPPALQDRETNVGANAFWPTVSTGGIVVRTVNATGAVANIANPIDSPPSGAVAVLISHGKNGYGARNVTGNQNDSSAAGADEQQNASPVSGTPMSVVVFSRDITDADPGGSGHGPFDDLVMTIRRDDLISPLVTSGVLQANPLAAFSQAQDLVLGRLLATRVCLPTTAPTPPCTIGYRFTWPADESFSSTPWNVAYARLPIPPGPPTTLDSATPAGDAYILTAADGTTRTVTVDEVKGLIARNGLF